MSTSLASHTNAHSQAARPLGSTGSPPRDAHLVALLLTQLRQGHLTVHWPDGRVQSFGAVHGPQATLVIHDWQACTAALQSGDIGFAESYMDGHWDSTDLAALLTLLAANRAALDRLVFGHWTLRTVNRLRHWLNRNTRANSRRNIHAHYDLGNAFYRLWLDPSMNYSSAWFDSQRDGPFTQAQHAKVHRALDETGLQPGQRLLEIGCGWGALAEAAARNYGAQVTGVTLSTEQLGYARHRLQSAGLAAQADLRLQDYRDIEDGPYDAICSIEMVEAVGRQYWPTYFGTLHRLLKPGGRACIQSIVIRDDLFERYLRSSDFIQQYIFPGGCLPSPGAVRAQANAAGLRVDKELAFGADYAETCRRWRARFEAQRAEVLALGYDERFMRMWSFYLAYCEAGFSVGDIDVVQYTLVKD